MIERYTHPEMGAIWSDRRRYETWLEVELAAADATAEAGLIPREAAAELRARCAGLEIDIARIEEIERVTQHDVIAFTTAIAERVGPAARWLHFGLTSSDVLDTAQAIQMREACGLVIRNVGVLMEAVRERADEYRATPMIGRTHGVHAEPMTFGLKLALWYHELQRDLDRLLRARDTVSVGKISGAVGTFAHLDPSIEARVCERLGLQAAPVSSQVIQRDRHAELLSALAIVASSLDRFALEIRHLARTEVREVEEPFAEGQKGSSAMPHKRNPIVAERICGLARLVRGYAHVGLENIALWHERDISHSSAERVVFPDAFLAVDYMLDRFGWLMEGLVVRPERMRANLEATGGLFFSQRLLLALVESGLERDDAYRMVQRHAMRAWDEGLDFRGLVRSDTQIASRLELGEVFDLDAYTKHVDAIFGRVAARLAREEVRA
jgi:adenylosuccinate lyase